MNGADLDDLTLDQLKDMVALLCNKIDELQEKVNNIEKQPMPIPDTWTVPGTVVPTTFTDPSIVVTTTAGSSGSWTAWKTGGDFDE